jgi:hypothetical protein
VSIGKAQTRLEVREGKDEPTTKCGLEFTLDSSNIWPNSQNRTVLMGCFIWSSEYLIPYVTTILHISDLAFSHKRRHSHGSKVSVFMSEYVLTTAEHIGRAVSDKNFLRSFKHWGSRFESNTMDGCLCR